MVSVIIPVFNGAAHVEGCIRSVMMQTYDNLEIIIIDDGSTDESYQICSGLAKEDDRIRLVHQENAGVSESRNRGMAMARGTYISFVDADDFLPADAIRLLMDNIRAMNSDMAIGAYMLFRWHYSRYVGFGSKQLSSESIRSNVEQVRDSLLSPWGRLYKKEIIDQWNIRFDRDIPYGEDHIFNLKYCSKVKSISTVENVVYRYRMGGYASTVKYYPNKDLFAWELIHAYDEFFGENEVLQVTRSRILKSTLMDCFIHYIVNGRSQEAKVNLQKTLQTFSPYINGPMIDAAVFGAELAMEILQRNADGIYARIYRQKFVLITKKKIKRLYYKIFRKRI